jgi:hypothetical protein
MIETLYLYATIEYADERDGMAQFLSVFSYWICLDSRLLTRHYVNSKLHHFEAMLI